MPGLVHESTAYRATNRSSNNEEANLILLGRSESTIYEIYLNRSSNNEEANLILLGLVHCFHSMFGMTCFEKDVLELEVPVG